MAIRCSPRLGLLALGLLLAACSTQPPPSSSQTPSTAPNKPSQSGATLTVAAAADLQFAFNELGRLFEAETGAKVTFSFGSSGNLATQIENGAPIDLFASADEDYVRQLARKGAVLPETERLYAIGRIALVTYKASGLALNRPEDLLKSEVKRVSIANPEHAPYGRAAKQALVTAGLWERLQPKLVPGENVRQALQFVQTGNAEGGIVALSIVDVPDVAYVLVDDSLYQPLRQSMVVVKGSKQEQLARSFADFVSGSKGRPVMKRYGFLTPEEK